MTQFRSLIDPSQANSREYQRQAIDAEIKSLEDSIRVLRHRRNSLAPVSSLPPEVIAAIFSFLPHMLAAITGTFRKKTDPLEWLRTSHVCHQWREIALNQPFLWNHIDFSNISSAGATEILARAKMAPLYLEARGFGSRWDDAQFSAFQEELQFRVPRIRHLLISAKFQCLRKILEGLISPAPTLESLSLSSEEPLYDGDPIPETLFGGKTPSLSSLELNESPINWESSLLKGIRFLEIRSPYIDARPSLSIWLDTLDEMRQLKMLTLHSASPSVAPPYSFEVQRMVTLPSLTHLDISSPTMDCALALAHLDLPALTWLCLEANVHFSQYNNDARELLPYVVRHAHGLQDAQPLRSALIRHNEKYIDFLAWTVPDIDVDVELHDPLTLLSATPPTRVALSFTSANRYPFQARIDIICAAMAALPLDGLVTFIVKGSQLPDDSAFILPSFWEVWLHNSPKWPLLRRIRLTRDVVEMFLGRLLADKGGCKNPLLPSLKELVLVDCSYHYQIHLIHDALMMRVEQGVPLEMLDLRACRAYRDCPAALQLLSEIVVDVLGPEENLSAREEIISMWDRSSWPLRRR